MSSTFPTLATASALPSPTQPAQGDSGPLPGISRSSSLLFGFLITFLALFVAFMGCGLGSRRALDVRRRRIAGAADVVSARRKKQARPHLWDVWIGEGAHSWKDMRPLSAALIRPYIEPELPPEPPMQPLAIAPVVYFPSYLGGRGGALIVPTPALTSSPAREIPVLPSRATSSDMPPSILSAWLPPFLRRRRVAKTSSDADEDKVESLRVAVLISMPSPRRRASRPRDAEIAKEDQNTLGEYAIGTADLPWEKGELG